MAGTKITDLGDGGTLADSDLFPGVDVSNTSQGPDGSTVKWTASNVATYVGTEKAATNTEAFDGTSTAKLLTPVNYYFNHSAERAKLKTSMTDTERATEINRAIDAASGAGNPLSVTRTANRAVEIPAGSWGIDSPIVGRSVIGLHLDGKGECELVAKADMLALIDWNGVRNGGITDLQLRGSAGVEVEAGLFIYWDNVASISSVTGNEFRNIWVRNLDCIDGIRVGKVGSTPAGAQVDNQSFWHCLVNGLNTTESYGSGTRYVNGFKLGNGTFGNNYGHHLYHCNVALFQVGLCVDATMMSLNGGDTGSNGVDYYINPGGYIEIANVRSEHSKRLLTTAGPSSGPNNVQLRNITLSATSLHADGVLIDYRLSGHLDLVNISITQPPIAPILSTNTSGNPLKVMIEGGGIRASATYTDPLVADLVAGIGSGTIVEWKDFAIANSAGAIQRVVSGASPAINAQTGTTYTFVNADQFKLTTLSNAGAITATIPPNSSVPYAIGTKLRMMQLGAGALTVAAGAGVTINGTLTARAQYSQIVAEKRATDTWFMSGDTTPDAVVIPTTQVDVYGVGSSTWNKPAGAQKVRIECVGPGGAGASGRRGAAGTVRCGGGGGSGGAYTTIEYDADDLPGSLTVAVSAGPTGGAAVTADDTNGNPGGAAATGTIVSASGVTYARANGGNPGSGGTATTGTGGVSQGSGIYPSGAGGTASTTGLVGVAGTAAAAGGGGGSGGGITTADVASAGGNGGLSNNRPGVTAPAGGAVGTAGTSPTPVGATSAIPQFGGGGGGSNTAGAAGAGAAGATPGGGGGGGGSSLNGNNSGAGGNGGDGRCVITSYP